MSAAETRLAGALALAPAALTLLAALLALRERRAAGAALGAALGSVLAGLVLGLTRWSAALPPDVPLFTWSPLGLYGVTFSVRPTPDAALLQLPPLLLASAGLAIRLRGAAPQAAGRVQDAFCLAAIASACQAVVAGDLVSLHLATGGYLLASAAILGAAAGPAPASRRLMLAATAAVGLLTCVLVLGKVNGHFALAQLSTAGFTWAPFLGLLLGAAIAAPVPPFHGWLLRLARHPLAPAVGAAGTALALALTLIAFRTAAGQFTPGWQRLLAVLGWAAILLGTGVAIVRRAPPVRLGALLVGHAGMVFLAAAVATPVSVAAALLDAALVAPCLGTLWLIATVRPLAPADRAHRSGLAWQHPAFWASVLLIASAAGLPGTIGGLARGALVSSLIAWPSGNQLLRLPPLILDVATLVIAGTLLWRPLHFQARRGWQSWTLLVATILALAGPLIAPAWTVERWFGPIAALAAGTGGAPLLLDLSRTPSPVRAVIGLIAAYAMVRHLRRSEWLPPVALAALGTAFVTWLELRRRWRLRGWGTLLPTTGTGLWARVERAAGSAMLLLRPLEERYYAAAAVMLAVALIYIIGR